MSPKSNKKSEVGRIGEDLTTMFLKKHKFSILQRNYRKTFGEIDIIAERAGILHFIEVKTVSRVTSERFSHETDTYRPEDNVHPMKLKRLMRTIQTYILEKKLDEREWVFDVAAVVLNEKDKTAKVDFIENIVL